MKRWATMVTVLLSVWFSSCLDFGAELEVCRDAGRCVALMGADGGSVSTDGGGSASTDAGGIVSTEQVALQTEWRHTEAGVKSTATTFQSWSFSLYVRNDSTFTQVTPGGPSGPGRYVFTDVPVGQRYLRKGKTWIVDPPSTVDFSYRIYGRTDRGFVDGGVRLEVSSSGMNSWVDGSQLELVSPNVGLVGFNFEEGLVNQLDAGLTPSSLVFDYVSACASSWGTDSPVPLIDTRKGDVVYLAQLEASSISDSRGEVLRLLTLVKSAQLAPIALESGTTKVSGVFSAPTQSIVVAIDWRRSAYWTQGPEVTPNCVFDSAYGVFSLVAIPYFGDEGVYQSAATLLKVGGTRTKGQSSDLAFARTIRNPYPPSWSLAAYRRYCHYGPAQTAGGSVTIQPDGCSVEWDPLDAVNGRPLTPGISPPTDLKVDGQPAYGVLTLTRTIPPVTWTAPTVGRVDSYKLTIWRLYNSGLDSELVATVLTRGTSLVIPSEVLKSGGYYYFAIVARNGADIAAPFKTGRSMKMATGVSGVLRVQ